MNCRRIPLHSSATPEKGVGLAMGLAITVGEEVVMVDVEVVDVVDEVAGMRTRRRLSTSSWNGKLFCTLVRGTSLRSSPRYHDLLYSRLFVILPSGSPTRKSLIVCVQCEHWTHTSTELPCGERRTDCWYATVLLKRVFQLLSRPLAGGYWMPS